MPGTLATVFILLVAVFGGIYQLYIHPVLKVWGIYSDKATIRGTRDCLKVPGLTSCEKIVLHQPSGLVYAACSTAEHRLQWFSPATVNMAGRTEFDYLVIYDSVNNKVKQVKFEGFDSKETVAFHGMDVVPSSEDPSKLFIYIVNHRYPPSGSGTPDKVGFDSVIDVFETKLGAEVVKHIKTVNDSSVIINPNDVVGHPDGKSFYFTNHVWTRQPSIPVFISSLFFTPMSSIGYCHIDTGCKYAAKSLPTNNGLVSSGNGTFYLASTFNGGIRVLEEQDDHQLIVTEVIPTESGMDNLSMDKNGAVWAAAFPKIVDLMYHINNPDARSPVRIFRLAANTGQDRFYGKNYVVDTIWEDDGTTANGITIAVHDAERGHLMLHGLMMDHLLVCKV